MRGSRVQAVVNELQGEKIDIIPWSADAATFIVNALQPAEVVKVVLDEDPRIEVVVPDDQLSLAIGRRGQNVRLASQLTGWDIDILTEAEESERRQKEFVERTNRSWRRSTSTRSSASRSPRRLPFGRGNRLRRTRRTPLRSKASTRPPTRSRPARRISGAIEAEHDARRVELGVADELKEIEGVTTAMLVKLGENDVKTVGTSRAAPPTIWSAGPKEGRRDREVHEGFLGNSSCRAGRGRGDDHGGRVKAGWIESRSRRARTSRRKPMAADALVKTMTGRRRTTLTNGPRGPAIVTRKGTAPDVAMIRFVLAPDGTVTPDLRRPAGPGAYGCHRQAATVAAAVKEGVRSRFPDRRRGRRRPREAC